MSCLVRVYVIRLVLSCIVLSSLVVVLSCLVLSCPILSCLVLSCLVLSCLGRGRHGAENQIPHHTTPNTGPTLTLTLTLTLGWERGLILSRGPSTQCDVMCSNHIGIAIGIGIGVEKIGI